MLCLDCYGSYADYVDDCLFDDIVKMLMMVWEMMINLLY